MSRWYPDAPLYQLQRRLDESGYWVELGADYRVRPRQLFFGVNGKEVPRAENDDQLAEIAEKWSRFASGTPDATSGPPLSRRIFSCIAPLFYSPCSLLHVEPGGPLT